MKKKKVFMYIVIILIILFVLGIGYLIYINLTMEKTNIEISEFIPAEEITDEQLRMTNIELYFFNEEIGELEIDVIILMIKGNILKPYLLLFLFLFWF